MPKAAQFRFSIPSLPRTIWAKFQEIRKAHGMTQRETLITAIVVLCEHGKQAPDEVEQIMREVKDCKYDEKVGEQRAM